MWTELGEAAKDNVVALRFKPPRTASSTKVCVPQDLKGQPEASYSGLLYWSFCIGDRKGFTNDCVYDGSVTADSQGWVNVLIASKARAEAVAELLGRDVPTTVLRWPDQTGEAGIIYRQQSAATWLDGNSYRAYRRFESNCIALAHMIGQFGKMHAELPTGCLAQSCEQLDRLDDDVVNTYFNLCKDRSDEVDFGSDPNYPPGDRAHEQYLDRRLACWCGRVKQSQDAKPDSGRLVFPMPDQTSSPLLAAYAEQHRAELPFEQGDSAESARPPTDWNEIETMIKCRDRCAFWLSDFGILAENPENPAGPTLAKLGDWLKAQSIGTASDYQRSLWEQVMVKDDEALAAYFPGGEVVGAPMGKICRVGADKWDDCLAKDNPVAKLACLRSGLDCLREFLAAAR